MTSLFTAASFSQIKTHTLTLTHTCTHIDKELQPVSLIIYFGLDCTDPLATPEPARTSRERPVKHLLRDREREVCRSL